MVQFQYQFGSPLVECLPFVQVVMNNQKNSFCDFCLKKILETSIRCTGCNNCYYCSSNCRENDYRQHQIECRLRLFDKIKKRLSITMENYSDSSSQVNQFNLSEYFDLNDMIDYTLLLFRMLKKFQKLSNENLEEINISHKESTSFYCKFGDYQHKIIWDDLSASTNIRSTRKRFRKPETDLSIYLSRFDALTYNEIEELDQLLGLDLPDNDHFRNTIIENNVKFTLRNIIECITDEITNDNVNSTYSLERDEMAARKEAKNTLDANKKDEPTRTESSEEDLFHQFVNDLQKKKFWENLKNSRIPYNQFTNYLSNHMFDLMKKSRKNSNRPSSSSLSSQKSFDKNLNEEFEDTCFYDSFPNDQKNYFSAHLNFDPSIIDKDEKEAIEMLKTNYRLIYLESLHKRSATYDTEMDYYFGFWLDEILKMLVTDANLNEYLGSPDYSVIEKVFFIILMLIFFQTIRYSIAISDEFCIIPIARAIYLPLTQIQHSCLPNTSIVFEGNHLKMYYLPEKRLQASQSSKNLNLNLLEIKVDFNHEISTKEESINVYILNKLRFFNCKCHRCTQTKKQVHSQINHLFDQFIDEDGVQGFDEEFSEFSPNNEFLNECDFMFNQYRKDYSKQKGESMNDHTASTVDYDDCFGRLSKANLLYGNRLDLEYSNRIQDLLVDMVNSFRQIFGYYHKQTTVMLLFINFCQLTIIKSRKDKIEIFFRFIYLHCYIVELIDSIIVTHGIANTWIPKIGTIHEICHHLLIKLFNSHETEINNLQKKLGKHLYDSNHFLLEHCRSLQENLISNDDLETIKKNLDDSKNIECHFDDYCYNPYMPDNDDVEPMDQSDDLQEEIIQNLDKMFQILNDISDFFLYRFL